MKIRRKWAAVIASLVGLGGCASQQPSPPADVRALFRQADKNGDGRVTREEFADFLIAEAFASYDQNRDGKVTLEEFLAGGGTVATFRLLAPRGASSFTLADALASEEVQRRMAKPFDEADVNGSGNLSWQEFLAWRERASAYIR